MERRTKKSGGIVRLHNLSEERGMLYLTKYMIGDYLDAAGIRVKILGKEPWRFTGLSMGLPEQANPERLYFPGEGEDCVGRRDFRTTENCCILRAVKEDTFSETRGEQEEIVCCCTGEEALRAAMSCFAFYKDWYLSLLEELLNGGSLQRLVELSIPVFRNPVAVSDIGFQVLAFTKEYHRQMEDAESKFICQYGVHSPEYIRQMICQKSFLENMERNAGPFRYHYDFLQHESVYCTIWLHGKAVGLLTIVGKNSIDRRSVMDEAGIFSKLLSGAFEIQRGRMRSLSMEESLALRVLKGEINDGAVVQDLFLAMKLKEGSAFCVAYVRMKNRLRMGQELLLCKAKKLLESKVRKGLVLTEENGLSVIAAADADWISTLRSVVNMVFPDDEAWIGVSYESDRSGQTAELYRQAAFASEEAQRQGILSGLRYERCMLRDILKNNLSIEQKRAAVYPAVQILQSKGTKTELYQTLKEYLMSEGDSAKTAAELNIHKNTLYYRLHQVEELLKLPLRDREIRECLRLSMYLLEIYSA